MMSWVEEKAFRVLPSSLWPVFEPFLECFLVLLAVFVFFVRFGCWCAIFLVCFNFYLFFFFVFFVLILLFLVFFVSNTKHQKKTRREGEGEGKRKKPA